MIGALIGTVSSSYVFAALGYVGVFSICSLSCFLAVIYIKFFIKESVRDVDNEVTIVLFKSLIKEITISTLIIIST